MLMKYIFFLVSSVSTDRVVCSVVWVIGPSFGAQAMETAILASSAAEEHSPHISVERVIFLSAPRGGASGINGGLLTPMPHATGASLHVTARGKESPPRSLCHPFILDRWNGASKIFRVANKILTMVNLVSLSDSICAWRSISQMGARMGERKRCICLFGRLVFPGSPPSIGACIHLEASSDASMVSP